MFFALSNYAVRITELLLSASSHQRMQPLVELANFKQSPIITQCRTGRRSKEALKIMASSGFTNLKNLVGGIIAWEKEGLKTVKKCC